MINICPWCDAVFQSVTIPKRCPDCKKQIERYEDMQPNDPQEPDESKGWGDPEEDYQESQNAKWEFKRKMRQKFDREQAQRRRHAEDSSIDETKAGN